MSSSSTPPGPTSDRSARLLKLAETRFGNELTDADRTLFRATANGEAADYGDGDPAEADTWGEQRTLQADRIRWLCTDPEAANEVLPHEGIWIKGARIEGQLWLSYVKVDFPLAIKQSVIPEGIVMQQTHLVALFLDGTHTGPITADGLQVDHALHMRNGFRASGEVRLLCARIGANFDCQDARFSNPNEYGFALGADGIIVTHDVMLRDGFEARGGVRLPGASIGGNFDCGNGRFINPDAKAYALTADGINVTGNVFLRHDFEADGGVRLLGATIGGNLDCDNGRFIEPRPYGCALIAERTAVTGSVFLSNGVHAIGKMNFTASSVGGWFIWTGVKDPHQCTLLDLESAGIGTLCDGESSWPRNIALSGLVYDRLSREAPLGAETRVEKWIRRHDHEQYLPQPYEQLAKVLKEMGHDKDAREVLIAKNKDPARLKGMSFPGRVWHAFLGWTIGYGYRPWQAVVWMLLFLAIGSVVFGVANGNGRLDPVKEGTCPEFNAAVYSLDAFVPLIDLHQAKYRLPTGSWLRTYLWLHIMVGWLLTSLLVVGLTGLVRR